MKLLAGILSISVSLKRKEKENKRKKVASTSNTIAAHIHKLLMLLWCFKNRKLLPLCLWALCGVCWHWMHKYQTWPLNCTTWKWGQAGQTLSLLTSTQCYWCTDLTDHRLTDAIYNRPLIDLQYCAYTLLAPWQFTLPLKVYETQNPLYQNITGCLFDRYEWFHRTQCHVVNVKLLI